MKKYKVHLSDDIYYTIEVTAKDEDEAIKKKLGILCDNKKCDVYSNLCNKELNVVEELLPNETKEDLLIAEYAYRLRNPYW